MTKRATSAEAVAACDYCHLPIEGIEAGAGVLVYCCLGCRLAAEITGERGEQGAVQWTLVRLGLAIFLSLNVMMFTMALWSDDLYDARAAGSGALAASLADLLRWLCLVLSLPVLFLLGGPLLDQALHTARRDTAAADFLILLGVGASFLYSIVSVVRGAGHVYFEVGCAVLVMVTLGRWLEAGGRLKTTAALDALQRLLPETVRMLSLNGHEQSVPLDNVVVGDRLRVLAGERIAVDGRIIAGCAQLDQQLLTGESEPLSVTIGDRVWGGSLNLDGDLIVEASAPAQAGSLARLVELVRSARESKGHYQRIADFVARWFLKLVLLVTVSTLLVYSLQGQFERGIMASLAVLLIACPCAIGLATPLAAWTALGAAARRGVLFRSGEAIERLATIRALRFDKTGTLTTGAPKVVELFLPHPDDREAVCQRAVWLAGSSRHVFSKAIAEWLASRDESRHASCGCAKFAGAVVRTSAGQGVAATFDDQELETRLGSLRWLQQRGDTIDDQTARIVKRALELGHSIVAVSFGGQVRGLFLLSETLRPGAVETLSQCAALGLDVAVLTGDHAARGRALAQSLGVEVSAGLLPDGKVDALRESRRRLGPVAMVGDGINDAPALAASDLGIALGCGADVSRESAGVCLLGDELELVPWAVTLARRTRRVMRQNLFWAFAYNTLGIALAAGGWLNPAWAALAMVLSSSLVVANSMRLAKLAPVDKDQQTDRSGTVSVEPSSLAGPDLESVMVPVESGR